MLTLHGASLKLSMKLAFINIKQVFVDSQIKKYKLKHCIKF